MNVVLAGSFLVTIHAFFLAILLFRISDKLSNKLLGFLLISLSLRVGKSVAGFVVMDQDYLLTVIGAVSMAFVGPLLYFFTRSMFETSFKLRIWEYLQLGPGVALLPFILITGETFLDGSYYVFTSHLLIYIFLSYQYLWHNRKNYESDDIKWNWIKILQAGIGLITITFILQLMFYDPIVYKLIVITAALVFYGLSLWAIPKSKLFLPEVRRKATDDHGYDDLGKRIIKLFSEEEVFTDPDLTVTKLAALLKSPGYLISRAINHCFSKSFSELLTEYRIKKSEQLLLADHNKLLTIEAIAYESGFNTLSSFYTSFKKVHKVTPAQFRDSQNPKMKIA